MNPNIEKLFQLSLGSSRTIIGLMSGTSVDGLDVALCKCNGAGSSTTVNLINFETIQYNSDFKNEIKSVFSKHEVDLEKVCLLNGWIAEQHANIINECLDKWKVDPESVDLIASHGQTIYHAPKFLHNQDKFSNATLQIGDGDHLAVKTGIITISDFRQKHIAQGGEGAPLAIYGDYLIFSEKGENRIMLNIGGIANFSFLPDDMDASKVFSTDTGTGNTLMDAFVQAHYPGKYFDEQASIASKGTINETLLANLKENDFFRQDFPKTTGPELFNRQYLENAIIKGRTASISNEDIMATLNRFSADTISDAIRQCSGSLKDVVVYTSGGGMHNPLLMKNIQEQLTGYSFKTTESLGINPDAKEALLFALLANECVAGGAVHIGNPEKGVPFTSMGKISFPK
ncbi:anhydro-N-acetylmuramic acid kinase [soil metagenome]